jgi:hypothetical protein
MEESEARKGETRLEVRVKGVHVGPCWRCPEFADRRYRHNGRRGLPHASCKQFGHTRHPAGCTLPEINSVST